MNEAKKSHSHIPPSLLFVCESGKISLAELEELLVKEIVGTQLRRKTQAAIVTRNEAANLILARLQTQLEQRGIHLLSVDSSGSTHAVCEMEDYLFGENR
ncbi:MAG: hypothetical protein KDA84_26025 [Planctomycetaceae bacterium]|nr:hypothetical protein [Planctomycetaceae bacterium]